MPTKPHQLSDDDMTESSQPSGAVTQCVNLSFMIPVQPVAWARARQNGKVRFTDPKVAAYKRQVAAVAVSAAAAMGYRCPVDGPVRMAVRSVFPVPQSWPKSRRALAMMGALAHTSKPDTDNLFKAVADALNGVVYRDDSQIFSQTSEKAYGAQPRVEVVIEAW